MPAVPPTEPVSARPAAQAARLSAAESAVIITAIAAVTVLAVLERPIPAVLTGIATAACLLLAGGRAHRLLTALTAGSRE
ncbi:hypothetical protein [Streptomyces tauricus]|uniref:hypothetical protein n=1 Tax=Streptomyces tauricus TaxID=68274 RepID=UPI002242E87A|nr:hypothetical protein [Streptomyces tauricus]MCW8103017.1 hypothetical protein [Streptomyces tauricus]